MHRQTLSLLVSDIGDVYIHWEGVTERFCNAYGIDLSRFCDRYRHLWAHSLYDGSLPCKAFWKEVSASFDVPIMGDPFTDLFSGQVIKPMQELYRRLKRRGVRIVSASNTYRENWAKNFHDGNMDLFDRHYPSHELHLAKPDEAYFRFIVDAEQAIPKETLFVDDREENIEGARTAGLPGYCYHFREDRNADKFASYLKRNFGFPS